MGVCSSTSTVVESLTASKLPMESAAGTVFMRARGVQTFAEVFMVIQGTRLMFYESKEREFAMHIVLAGSIAKPTPLRSDARGQYFFILVHPVCGTREFYAPTKKMRDLWLVELGKSIGAANENTIYGKVYKQGTKSPLHGDHWVARWAAVVDHHLMYFDSETSCDARGVIPLSATSTMSIRTYAAEGREFCFEIAVAHKGKALKKYHFAVEKKSQLDRWVAFIRKTVEKNSHPPPAHTMPPTPPPVTPVSNPVT